MAGNGRFKLTMEARIYRGKLGARMRSHGSFFFNKYFRIFHNRLDYASRCGRFMESKQVPRLAPAERGEHSQRILK